MKDTTLTKKIEVSSLAIELRYPTYVETKDVDILYYSISRLLDITLPVLSKRIAVETSIIQDELLISSADPVLLISIWDAISLIKISPLEVSQSFIRLPLRRFLDNSI